MFGRTRTVPGTTVVSSARGGISATAVITGVVVALGAMFLLSALAGGILTAAGITPDDVTESGAIEVGIGAGIVVVIAQFVAYLWGGYTAGRMARGAGVANGLLVPVIAIVIAVAVGAVVASLGATANLNLPFSTNRLPLEGDYLIDWGVGIAIAALAAMFLGGAIGGGLGARWHTRLEVTREEELAEEGYEAVVAASPRNGDGTTSTTPAVTRTTSGTPTTER
jgi:hypothetical protein